MFLGRIAQNSAVATGSYGTARRPDAARLRFLVDEFLLRMTILPLDSEAAQHYGQIRTALESEGQPMGNLDTMVGAHALALGAALVTNHRAFSRIEALKVEDWTKP